MTIMQRFNAFMCDVLGIVSPSRYLADAEYHAYVHRHKRFASSIRYLVSVGAVPDNFKG